MVGYPDGGRFLRSEVISDKLEHLNAQYYLQDGRASFKHIAKRRFSKVAFAHAIATFGIFRTKRTKINTKYLKGPKTILNISDYMIKSPYIFLVANYAPTFITQLILNRMIRKYELDMIIISAPSVISNRKTPAKVAHFVHDTMPFELIEAPMDNDTPRRYAKQFHSTCVNSDLIFTNSTDTAEKVRETNPQANVHVLYGTASSRREDLEDSNILERKKLTKNKYLLFTSTVEKRKNVEGLMEAYAKVHDEMDMPLVIVGAQGYGYDDIEAKYESLPKNVQKKILFLGYVTEADKFALFDNAFAFVFPSYYEGMGLMLVEAMQANTPIISSSRGALSEVGGDAVLYINDPYDTDEIAGRMVELKNNPKLAQKLVKNGQSQQKKFTFEKFTERFAKAMSSVKPGVRNAMAESSFSMTAMRQLVFINKTEVIVLIAIFLNMFTYWPTIPFDGLGGFSLELSMLSGLLLVARGVQMYGASIMRKLMTVWQFGFIYAWIGYGAAIGLMGSDSPATILVKTLYLLSTVVGAHVVAAMYVDKVVSAERIIKAWVVMTVLMAPIFLIQYILVSLGVDDVSKRAYQVGIFEFPRLHGFSFEPLFLANWLLVPAIFAITKMRANRAAATILALLIFLTLARGAIIALFIALVIYALATRLGIKQLRFLFRPVFHALIITLIMVGFAAHYNGSTVLQGAFRYMDHLTLGVFNSGGADNVSTISVETSEGTRTVINTREIDREGAVEASAESRVEAMKLGIEMFEDNPITGTGLFRFGEAVVEKYPEIYDDTGIVANSQPIDILAETGLIGAAIIAAFMVASRKQLLAFSIPVILLLALSIQFLFFTGLYLLPFWFILGVVLTGKVTKDLRFG